VNVETVDRQELPGLGATADVELYTALTFSSTVDASSATRATAAGNNAILRRMNLIAAIAAGSVSAQEAGDSDFGASSIKAGTHWRTMTPGKLVAGFGVRTFPSVGARADSQEYTQSSCAVPALPLSPAIENRFAPRVRIACKLKKDNWIFGR